MRRLPKSLMLACLLLAGCATPCRYVEGTSIALGAYIPWEGNLYGAELISYLNGVKYTTSTNKLMYVEHDYCSTNSWLWGMMDSVTTTKTKIEEKSQ